MRPRVLWGLAGLLVVAMAISQGRGQGSRERSRATVAVVLAAMTAGIAIAGLQVSSRDREPLAQWASERATAQVEGTVAGFPRVRAEARRWALTRTDVTTRTTVRLRDLVITARGQHVRLGTDVLLDLPGSWAPPAFGSRIIVRGRLAPATAMDVGARLRVDVASGSLEPLADPGPVDAVVESMRTGLRSSLKTIPTAPAGIVAGLAIGDESLLPTDLAEEMRDSGLAHLLAVSGGNVAIVLVVAIGAARAVGLGIRGRVIVGLAALLGFVLLVGPEASVLRAAAMGATTVAAMLAGGRRSGLSTLAFATIAVLLIVPEFAVSWAFALSVAATLGILAFVDPIANWLRARRTARYLPPVVLLAIAVTLSAQFVTLPLLVLMGAQVSAAAVPANLLAMPAVPAVTVLGLLAALVAPISSFGADVLCWIAQWPAAWIVRVARTYATWSGPAIPVGGAGLAVVLAILVVIGLRAITVRAGGRALRIGRPLARFTLACVVLAVVLPWAFPRPWPVGDWWVIGCDVGQGDAVLVRARSGQVTLIDTGPPDADLPACLSAAGVRVIDLLVLTHFHLDHVGGTATVLATVPVRRALVSGVAEPAGESRLAHRLLADAHVPVEIAAPGMVRELGSMNATVLWPPPRSAEVRSAGDGSTANNGSIVLLIRDGPRRLLLTGDIEATAQAAVMAAEPAGDFDVVKIPHHGSRAGVPGFAAWASARVAIVSVGAGNPYGHPVDSVLADWRATGAQVCRIDTDGSCAVIRAPAPQAREGLTLARQGR